MIKNEILSIYYIRETKSELMNNQEAIIFNQKMLIGNQFAKVRYIKIINIY